MQTKITGAALEIILLTSPGVTSGAGGQTAHCRAHREGPAHCRAPPLGPLWLSAWGLPAEGAPSCPMWHCEGPVDFLPPHPGDWECSHLHRNRRHIYSYLCQGGHCLVVPSSPIAPEGVCVPASRTCTQPLETAAGPFPAITGKETTGTEESGRTPPALL